MTRLTWILYLLGAALVLGSYFGLVGAGLAWIGWAVASFIALASWCGWIRNTSPRTPTGTPTGMDGPGFNRADEEAARREIYGDTES